MQVIKTVTEMQAELNAMIDEHEFNDYAFFGFKRPTVTAEFVHANLDTKVRPEAGEYDTWGTFLFANGVVVEGNTWVVT